MAKKSTRYKRARLSLLRDVIVAIAARSREMVRRYEARERLRYARSKTRLKRSSQPGA